MGGLKMTTIIELPKAKKHLAVLWYLYGGVLFIIFFLQSLSGKYGTQVQDAWSWFLPTILPSLTLITGVLVADALQANPVTRNIDRFIYTLTLAVSAIYLILVSLVIFLQPFFSNDPFVLMKSSNFGLAPFQGIVTACIGVFFTKKESSQK